MIERSGYAAAPLAPRHWVAAILIAAWVALMLGGSASAGSLDTPAVTARSVFAFDPASGEVILAHNPDERLPIGSVTKVMTALVVVDHLAIDDEITVSGDDMLPPGFSAMGLQPGDTLTVEQLLTGLLVASGGDSARALAREVGGQLAGTDDPAAAAAAFVEAMNARGGELGLADTSFANADGEDSADAWSTARDVATMYAALTADPSLAGIAGQASFSFTSVGLEQTLYEGVSTNLLAGQHEVTSAKTGSTQEAGGCVVLARRGPGGGTEVVAILGSHLEYDEYWNPVVDQRWDDAVAVIEAIDAGWTPGQFLAALPTSAPLAGDDATDTIASDAPAADTGHPRPTTVAVGDSRPILVTTVALGVLVLAGIVSWSRLSPARP